MSDCYYFEPNFVQVQVLTFVYVTLIRSPTSDHLLYRFIFVGHFQLSSLKRVVLLRVQQTEHLFLYDLYLYVELISVYTHCLLY